MQHHFRNNSHFLQKSFDGPTFSFFSLLMKKKRKTEFKQREKGWKTLPVTAQAGPARGSSVPYLLPPPCRRRRGRARRCRSPLDTGASQVRGGDKIGPEPSPLVASSILPSPPSLGSSLPLSAERHRRRNSGATAATFTASPRLCVQHLRRARPRRQAPSAVAGRRYSC